MKNTSSTKTELRVKTPLVSVIIPVFNVEEYLEECINSILRQTLTDIEIICINDGSTDSSPDILKKYAEQDRRITVYSQDNCGLSAARNLGMRAARGRYTYFIDSDDWLERDALRDLYTRAEKDQLDLLLFVFEVVVLVGDNSHDLRFIKKSGQLLAVRLLRVA